MSLDGVNELPESISQGAAGHNDDHVVIHKALKEVKVKLDSFDKYHCELPLGLGWDTSAFPVEPIVLSIRPDGSVVGDCAITADSIFDQYSTARTSPGTELWVDPNIGNDTTGNGTQALPFATCGKAQTVANTAGLSFKGHVIRSLPRIPRGSNPTAGGSVLPTVDTAWIAHGRVNTGTYDNISAQTPPALDATHTNCYTITIATANNIDKVVDVNNLGRGGNYAELTYVPTPARCNITPGSWTVSGTTVYVNRSDGAPVTINNTRYYRPSAIFKINAHVNVYIGGNLPGDGFDCEGGQIGGLDTSSQVASQTADKILAVKNCTFRYTGGLVSNSSGRSIAIDSWRGLAILENCHASAAQTDLFNFHNGQANPRCHILTLNCTGFDAGRPGQPSNNGHTSHEDVKVIDIAGNYEDTRGGCIRNIHTSKAYFAGTKVINDMGDITLGSASAGIGPTAFRADDSAEIWCEYTDVRMPAGTIAYSTGAAGAKIHKKNVQPTGASDYSALGTIDNLWN